MTSFDVGNPFERKPETPESEEVDRKILGIESPQGAEDPNPSLLPGPTAAGSGPTSASRPTSSGRTGGCTEEELLRAFDSGYAGEEAPLGRDRSPRTREEKQLTEAWARGVWQRQGEQETRSRVAKREEWVREMRERKIEVPDAALFEQSRAERAAEYARKFEAGEIGPD